MPVIIALITTLTVVVYFWVGLVVLGHIGKDSPFFWPFAFAGILFPIILWLVSR